MRLSFPQLIARIGFSALAAIIGILFALPLIWFIFAPFNARAELGIAIPDPWTLQNFLTVFGNGFAMPEMSILTAVQAQRFEARLAVGNVPESGMGGTLMVRNRLPMRIATRV